MAKDFLEKFESISEFQRAINTREVHEFYKDILSSENATKTFTGTESYEEAENLLSYGDKSIAAKLVECNGKRMNEAKRDALKPEEELVDVLLDFIIVSATLAKKVTQAVRERQIKEGAYKDVKNERTGCRDQRPANCGCRY